MANKKKKKKPLKSKASQSQAESPQLQNSAELPTSQQVKQAPKTAKIIASNAASSTILEDDAALAVAHVLSTWHAKQSNCNLPSGHMPSSSVSQPDVQEISSESTDDEVELNGAPDCEPTWGNADEDESEEVTLDSKVMNQIFEEVMTHHTCSAKATKKTRSPKASAVSGAVGKKMVGDPCSLHLGYSFLWNKKGKKETPMSLENEE
ncbi:hypothetical protein J3A83DRAFT_4184631 [Scleroderma citrinum]